MKELDLVVKKARRFKVTTNSKHKSPWLKICLIVSLQSLRLIRPGSLISPTYVYLAAVVDLFSRKVMGWAMSHRMTTDLALDTPRMAYWCRKPAAGLLHHSDQGRQYATHEYQNELKKHRMVCTMSRQGNCSNGKIIWKPEM